MRLTALAAIAAPTLLWAQVSLYQFSQSTETYTEITATEASYSLGLPVYWPPQHNLRVWVNNEYFGAAGQVTNGGYLSGVYGPGYPIGFDFTFNGEVFDRIGISHQGWISFGKSSDGNQAVWCYAADHPHGRPFVQYIGGPDVPYKRNRVAGWGYTTTYMQDLSSLDPPGTISSLLVGTIGTAPNRTCVIQFHDFMMAYPPTSSRINYQIRLNEADNSVEVRFGTIIISSIQPGNVQIGLGGQVPEDFNSRMTVYEQPSFLYDLNNTVAGILNTDACYATAELTGHPNGSGIPPVVGLNFKWTPDACPPPVWPLVVDQMSFDSGHASWEPTNAQEYEYFLTDTNFVGGPEVTAGTTTDPEVFFFGLEPSTTYYLFVRGICGGEPGAWSLATPLETLGGGILACDGSVMTEDYCSAQHDTKEWLYISGDGSPLKIEFQGGVVDNTPPDAYFTVWDGSTPSGAGTSFGGDISGHMFTAMSGAMYIRLVTDVAACQAQYWYLHLQWRVGCKNCLDPLASFSVVEDCANMEYSVAVDIANLGSSATVNLQNSLGVQSVVAGATGTFLTGPFPAGQSVIVTVQNPDNPICYTTSAPLLNAPCAITDCGPATYTYCYDNNELRQWAYQGEGSQEIGIRFIRGNVQYGDQLQSYNGLDVEDIAPTNLPYNLANLLITSAAPSTDHALVLELLSNNNGSCADGELSSGEWEYVVACYDGCTQPQATFTTSCVSTTQYEVVVNLTEVGSSGSVQITNNGGAATVAATAAGTYTVGPFNAGTPVTVEVEGASILCTWTSPALVKQDCSDYNIGIAENGMGTLQFFPNPNTGRFTMQLPSDFHGMASLRVTDVSGRIVARQELNGTGMTEVQLPELPNGLYALALESNRKIFNGTIIIQR